MSRCFSALDVVVQVPAVHEWRFRGFPAADRPPDVVVDEADPVLLSGAVTRAVVDRTELLCVHAAVVHAPSGALVLPAYSGAGKSTLTLALVRAGFGLMSDEVAAFRPDGGAVVAFPRPVTLDATGGGETAVDASRIGALGPGEARVAGIVLPRRSTVARSAQGGTTLTATASGDAAAALVRHGFNHFRDPPASLRTIAEVVAGAAALEVSYVEATDAARLLSKQFDVA